MTKLKLKLSCLVCFFLKYCIVSMQIFIDPITTACVFLWFWFFVLPVWSSYRATESSRGNDKPFPDHLKIYAWDVAENKLLRKVKKVFNKAKQSIYMVNITEPLQEDFILHSPQIIFPPKIQQHGWMLFLDFSLSKTSKRGSDHCFLQLAFGLSHFGCLPPPELPPELPPTVNVAAE